MRYNLTPLKFILNDNIESDQWMERFTKYFGNQSYDQDMLDEYYDILYENLNDVREVLLAGYLIDEYSGLFTFNTPVMEHKHSFNIANFIRRNHLYFNKKKIAIIACDYGIANIQVIKAGLDLSFVSLPEFCLPSAVLCAIGNGCRPYAFNVGPADVYFGSNVFLDDYLAHLNWNFLLEQHLNGNECYLSSNSFEHLHNHALFKKLKQVEDPQKVYAPEEYANLDMGYNQKIYKII